MKTDNYTKFILSVIAAALVTLTIQNFGTKTADASMAHDAFRNVAINPDGSINVNLLTEMDVNLKYIGGSSVYGSLPVNLKEVNGSSIYGTLPVNLKEVSGSSISSYGLPVNIESLNGSSIYDHIPVKIKN